MRRLVLRLLVANVAIALCAQAEAADIERAEVVKAIESGVAFLKREQSPRGTWTDHPGYPNGVTALCTLALLNAGVDIDDPQIQRALAHLRTAPPNLTYPTALQTMVLCAAEPRKDKLLISKNVRWFEENQIRGGPNNGSWSYPRGGGDNSNTQFAMLALHEAELAGVPVSEQTWRLAHNFWKAAQNVDGSWGYHAHDPGTGSMTCAGIASMVITTQRLGEGDATVVNGNVHCCGQQQEATSIENGLAWLGRNFSVHSNPSTSRMPGIARGQTWLLYYLYGVERVGRMTGRRFIGDDAQRHDWYREGARMFLDTQDKLSGFWKGNGHAEDNPHIATSLALLFLSKGRRPVVVAKLEHGPGNDWNHHRNDLANLTSYVETKWERPLAAQTININEASVEDLLQAPVLFINGSKRPEFTDEQVLRLRDYLDRGGFIFAEATCPDCKDFDRGFRDLMQRMFPEPEYALRLLPPEHPIWHVEEKVAPEFQRPLLGVDYGCRTSVVYSPPPRPEDPPGNLSCYWELWSPGKLKKYPAAIDAAIQAANSIGINVLAYATNREPKYKDEIPTVVEPVVKEPGGDRGVLQLANLKHPGGCDAAPGALVNLLRAAQRELKLRVSLETPQVSMVDKSLAKFPVVMMHGRNSFRLTPEERKHLRTHLERGGTLLADSICASKAFTAAFRSEMQAMFPEHKLESIPPDHPLFTRELGGYDLSKVRRQEPHQRPDGPMRLLSREAAPELEGIKLGDRYAVIFSKYDLSCALEKLNSLECEGYSRDDAERIALNVLLYALHQ